jgi:hypothetical protein
MERRMNIPFLRGIGLTLLAVAATTALAAPNSRASCVGLIVADHARWGDFPELMHDIQDVAAFFELPTGQLIRQFAKLHLGSHQICGNE